MTKRHPPDHDPRQLDLPLSFPELNADLPLMPVRMVNEFQYCPRLAYLEWVQGEWESSADTVEGTYNLPPTPTQPPITGAGPDGTLSPP